METQADNLELNIKSILQWLRQIKLIRLKCDDSFTFPVLFKPVQI